MKTLYNKKEIRKRTDKAVLIFSDIYENIFSYDPYDPEYLQGRWKMQQLGDDGEIWLPLSQIEIKDGFVVKVKSWLAQKFKFKTQEYVDFVVKKREEGAAKYMELLEKAKKLGIKGIRKGLKTRTIFAKAKAQGIPLENLL